MTVLISRAELSKISRHAEETYPEECCGFLIGTDGPNRKVVEARRATNIHPTDRGVRYTVDPREHLRLELEIRGTGREVLGFYHSHPDHPGVPSTFDVERSWRAYSYIIVEVRGGKPDLPRGFRIDPEGGTVREEPVSVATSRRPSQPKGEQGRRLRRRRKGRPLRGA